MIDSRAMRLAALGVWILVGLPVVMQGANTWQLMAQWSVAYLLFGILFFNDRLALASASIIVMVLLLCDGFEGALMVLIAMRLGSRVDRNRGIAWIAIQTLLLAVAITIHWSLRPALLLAPPYLGFQLLAFFTMRQMQELHALKEIAAGTSRIADQTFAWGPRDMFVVPSWTPVSHQTHSEAVLFSFSDRPAQKALGLWREHS